jgi:2-dehydro-3-deoxyphosphogluconate aldolase/(4S)-4-hydroxy-2-oxoglutarate aldolase
MPPDAARIPPTPQLIQTGVVAILRGTSLAHLRPVANALALGGVTCLEITATMPDWPVALRLLSALQRPGQSVGAGTITSAEQAREAIDCGATFLVSPAVCEDVLAVGVQAGVPCYPGAWTPTEVLTAWRLGAAAVKLFPAASGGPAHLKMLRDPLPAIPIVPTGGIGLDQVGGYITAGAVAVGLGSSLLGDALSGGDLQALTDRAGRALRAVAAARAAG